MRTTLAIIFLTIATHASAQEIIRAITSGGKEVLLSEQDMTWEYANRILDKKANLIYSDEFLEIELTLDKLTK